MTAPPTTGPASPRSGVRRLEHLARYDRPTIDAILDAGVVAHVGVVDAEGQPFVIPMVYGRDGDRVLVHGSAASRTVRAGAAGASMCLTVTLLDGLVVARSLFESSLRYRSVVVLGHATPIDDPDAKLAALLVLSERLMPGRVAEARLPNDTELAATRVFALPLDEASAKVSAGFSDDSDTDVALPVWAGVVPVVHGLGDPIPAPDLAAGIEVPPSVRSWSVSGPLSGGV